MLGAEGGRGEGGPGDQGADIGCRKTPGAYEGAASEHGLRGAIAIRLYYDGVRRTYEQTHCLDKLPIALGPVPTLSKKCAGKIMPFRA